jgi:hypothetical protein
MGRLGHAAVREGEALRVKKTNTKRQTKIKTLKEEEKREKTENCKSTIL